ncbi:MAG: cobalamin-independent methionine synthase II family protein [Burkholderiales bacterium]|nr:cobalamin-independent methionine synthase II family protein [Burkholderiales bacterium]
MQESSTRILTTHVGSLPRPDGLIEANRTHRGENSNEAAFQALLREAVIEVVKRQRDAGIDQPGDGEFGKAMGHPISYGAWWSYSFQRLSGLELAAPGAPYARIAAGELTLTDRAHRRDRARFPGAYAAGAEFGVSMGPELTMPPVCVGPLRYVGQAAIAADITNFKAALAAAGLSDGFMTSLGPGSAARIGNRYYASEEEFLFGCAEAMRDEYRAIVDAGLMLQIDDPSIAESWDQIVPEPGLEAYRRHSMRRVEALNHALRGLPPERIRFHLCWGSWHGPHSTDIPMREIVDVMLAVNCQAYSFEAGNARHEHEWKLWQEVRLPEDKRSLPGVVSHATTVVEHPELVAERIERFAAAVGRERVIASTDCGLGGRIHPEIAWAKLEALAQGAAIASKRLWA